MMEAAPAAPFKMPEAYFLFQLQIIPFYTPAQLGEVDEFAEADIGWQRRQPIFGRLGFARGAASVRKRLRQSADRSSSVG
jgi:hypothetical protein